MSRPVTSVGRIPPVACCTHVTTICLHSARDTKLDLLRTLQMLSMLPGKECPRVHTLIDCVICRKVAQMALTTGSWDRQPCACRLIAQTAAWMPVLPALKASAARAIMQIWQPHAQRAANRLMYLLLQ
jgi:hypothetical protein